MTQYRSTYWRLVAGLCRSCVPVEYGDPSGYESQLGGMTDSKDSEPEGVKERISGRSNLAEFGAKGLKVG